MTVKAHIRGTGHIYISGDESLEIWIQKSSAAELPFVVGQMVPITLVIDGASYEAGLRATENNDYVWISPKLRIADGTARRISDVARIHALKKNQTIDLTVSGTTLTLTRRSA